MTINSDIQNIGRAKFRRFFTSPSVSIVRIQIEGTSFFFAVDNNTDLIQRHHLRGKFYEIEELEIIRKHFPKNGVFLDIGANVGNHTLYALKMLGASKSIVIEPNKVAYDLLVTNIVLNSLEEKCDFSGIGMGLSDTEVENMGVNFNSKNVGGGRLIEGEGDIPTQTGDSLIGDQVVDFIKLDVEGMELAVLQGLENTISRFRPPLFIEVDNKNDEQFKIWLDRKEYKIVDTFKRYRTNCNYMILPDS